MLAAETLGVSIAELRWMGKQDGSMWLDAARVMRYAKGRAEQLKKGQVTIVQDDTVS
jgi:hypothetical protein